MINCSIHNYKDWMDAYLNGSLSREDMLTVEAFLQKNPRIFDQYLLELEALNIRPENISLDSKNELNIQIQPTKNIDTTNFPEYFIGYYEGNLTAIEKTELHSFIDKNPKLKKEFELYGSTNLIADASIVYPNKNELFKRTRPVVPLFWSMSAAASIILVVGLWLFWPAGSNQNGITMGAFNKIQFNKQSRENIFVAEAPEQNKTEKISSNNNRVLYSSNDTQTNKNSTRTHSIPVETKNNKKVEIQARLTADELAFKTIPDVEEYSNVPLTVAETPKKKGLLNKLFSGEKLYIEDYVNATFTAFKNNKEDDDKWVLKVERDNKGKSKKVKFTSPIFSFKTKN